MRVTGWVGAVAVIASCGVVAAERRESPDLRLTLKGHPGGVTAITFTSKSDLVATGSGNGIVRVWFARKEGPPIAKRDEMKGTSITGLTFAPDGSILAASGKGKAGMWSPPDLRVNKPDTLSIPKFATADEIRGYRWLAFPSLDSEADYSDSATTGDGKEVYITRRYQSLTYPGKVLRYDKVRDVTEERPGPKYYDPRAVACISDPDSGVAAVYGTVGEGEKAASEIRLFGFGDGKVITRGVPQLTKEIRPRISFSTDGRWLAAWSGSLALWSVPGSHIIGGEPASLEHVHAVAIGPRNLMATVSPPHEFQKATVVLWELSASVRHYSLFGIHWIKQSPELKKLISLETTLKDVGCLAFSPDGLILAVGGSTDGVVQMWKVDEY